ncbi:hypothetical protein ACTJJ0_17115 [Chitinophaga sp. 22321]|uniref:Uncharacterized protein n=1 Tax=Chitinophaga hostae TaxID=2831022 RepID=A0ABS5J3Q8_9BACT|nr:hypothetical protein [Chitinophaga hostae]MBS0029713.1 hypothetical protein [Chitinophaga hostae]
MKGWVKYEFSGLPEHQRDNNTGGKNDMAAGINGHPNEATGGQLRYTSA